MRYIGLRRIMSPTEVTSIIDPLSTMMEEGNVVQGIGASNLVGGSRSGRR
jgi:hypothetical protein